MFLRKKKRSKTGSSLEKKENNMKRSILSAGEFMIQSNDEKSEEEAFKREENVSRRASEQIRHEGNAVVQNNICSNFEIQRNDIESGIQGNVYNSPVTYCAENRPQKDGRHRKFKPASIVMYEIKQAGLKVPFLPTGMQSEIYQNNTVGCNELQLNCCNNTREQVTCSGGKRSSGIDRRRKFNPTSVVNFETEHDGPKVLFPPRRLHSDVFPSNTAGCNDFQRKDHESSCNNMQEKLVTCNGEKRPSGIEQHRELIPALLPVFEIHQSGLKVPFPPFNYQPDIQRNNITAYNESKRKGHETSCYNTTEEQVSHIASWNETQRPKEDHRSSCINTHDYLVICNGENRTNGIARRRKFNPSSVPVAILDSEQAGLKVPFPPRSIQSNIFHSNKAHRNEFQRKDHQTSSYDTHEEQVQNRPSGIARCRKFNPTSVVSCETQQAAGFQEPFQSRRMQSDIFENNATGCNVFQRNDHQASFNNTHEEQVASNGGNRPSGIARRRKFNPASVVSYETEQACFQVPFPPRRMQSYDFENNATDCNEFQRKDHQASSYDIHEEQVASNEENRPSGIARHRKYNPAFVVSCKTEQAGFHVPFPPRRMQSVHR